MFAWTDLLTAVALFLVLEGIMPFINPDGVKRVLAKLIDVPSRDLRIGALGSIVAGLVVLIAVRSSL